MKNKGVGWLFAEIAFMAGGLICTIGEIVADRKADNLKRELYIDEVGEVYGLTKKSKDEEELG